MSIWQAPDDIRKQIDRIKDEHHPHIAQASVWPLCTDSKAIKDNRIVVADVKKCTAAEKLSTGCDFKLTIYMEAWANLPDDARRIMLDEALCGCGVRFVPATVEVNGRKEIVKDEWGRTIFTDEIDYDKEGLPKWKVNRPDASVFFAMINRHGPAYSEAVENIQRVCAGKPPKGPSTTPLFDEAKLEDAVTDAVLNLCPKDGETSVTISSGDKSVTLTRDDRERIEQRRRQKQTA